MIPVWREGIIDRIEKGQKVWTDCWHRKGGLASDDLSTVAW